MGAAVETSARRVRGHLSATGSRHRKPTNEPAGNTVGELDRARAHECVDSGQRLERDSTDYDLGIFSLYLRALAKRQIIRRHSHVRTDVGAPSLILTSLSDPP